MTDQPPKSEELLNTLLSKDAVLPAPVAPGIFPPEPAAEEEDVDTLIDEFEHLLTEAKRVPFGKKLMVDEDRALALVDRLRTAVPNEVKQAHRILDEQERIISAAQIQARDLLTERGLMGQLDTEREQVIARATAEADRIRADADRYVRRVLEELNDRLAKAQLSIQKGIETLGEQ